MNDLFRHHALSYGDDGKKWLSDIPLIIKRYEIQWDFKALQPYNLTYNYIAPVVFKNGSRAVLKIGYPKDTEFQSEMNMLSLVNGDGIVQLLKSDQKNAVILIEEVTPGTPLSDIIDDTETTRIHASVMMKLWKPLPKYHTFIGVADWAKALYEPNEPFPQDLVHSAIHQLEELLATSASPVLTHADLHHDNILLSDRNGWIAIDPKGIAAEPCYDTTAMIRNPYKLISTMSNINALLTMRIHILAEVLNFNPERIRKWCFVQTVLSGVWCREDKKDLAHAVKVAQSLERITL